MVEYGDDRSGRGRPVPCVEAADDLTRIAQQGYTCRRPLGRFEHPGDVVDGAGGRRQ